MITILSAGADGEPVEGGAYVLCMSVAAPLSLSFGRFRGGQPIAVPPGGALYVGSAMGRRGSSTLARRLLRHATRSGSRPPHAIRDSLYSRLRDAGMGGQNLLPPTGKTVHWHIDYLLDQAAVELTHILAIRTENRLETRIAQQLRADPDTAIIAAGLGATDSLGATHLFHLHASSAATISLLSRIDYRIDDERRFSTSTDL